MKPPVFEEVLELLRVRQSAEKAVKAAADSIGQYCLEPYNELQSIVGRSSCAKLNNCALDLTSWGGIQFRAYADGGWCSISADLKDVLSLKYFKNKKIQAIEGKRLNKSFWERQKQALLLQLESAQNNIDSYSDRIIE